MKNLNFIVLAVIFSVIAFAFSSQLPKVQAGLSAKEGSKCRILPFKEAFQDSEAVFVGRVIGEEKDGNLRTFEFEVEKYWKGAEATSIRIDVYETPRFQAWFKTGETYLIYAAAAEEGNLRVSRCSRSRAIENAAEDLEQLGEGKNPQ